MKSVSQTKSFTKDIKRMAKRRRDLAKMRQVVGRLARGETLDAKFRDHPLRGEWIDSRDCHVEPDWVLIYTADAASLRLERTGTYADLFE